MGKSRLLRGFSKVLVGVMEEPRRGGIVTTSFLKTQGERGGTRRQCEGTSGTGLSELGRRRSLG